VFIAGKDVENEDFLLRCVRLSFCGLCQSCSKSRKEIRCWVGIEAAGLNNDAIVGWEACCEIVKDSLAFEEDVMGV
jgi:hypothetical protein